MWNRVESFGRDPLSHLDLGSSCGKSQKRAGHKSSHCTGEQCTTFHQCGWLNLHKNKKKLFESKRCKLKKLVKDLNLLEAESKHLKDLMQSKTHSFGNIVKPYLIRSNPSKYLTSLHSNVLPITKTINIGIAILKKHYNSEVPSNLEEASDIFQEVISSHNERFNINEKFIEQKLNSELNALQPEEKSESHQFLSSLTSPFKKRSKTSDSICSLYLGLKSHLLADKCACSFNFVTC